MAGTLVTVVFDLEGELPMPLGLYVSASEDSIRYLDPSGAERHAPADCVTVATVNVYQTATRAQLVAETEGDSSARTLHPFARMLDSRSSPVLYVATDDDGAVYVRSYTHGRWQCAHSGLSANAGSYVTRCAGNFGWSVERYDATTGDYYPSAEATRV